MCKECGCGDALKAHDSLHRHAHTDAEGNVYYHTHVRLEQPLLAANDLAAAENRGYFRARKLRVLNLISSPGSGKTELLVRTLAELRKESVSAAVIVGDPYGEFDAERMRKTGAPVTQIQVHESCHLTAQQISAVLDSAVPQGTQLLFIENVGNLVCPVAFDLGESEKIALLSTPEGEEKPLKYPALFSAAHTVLLTKSDLAEVLGWNRELCIANIRKVNSEAEIIELSAKTGTGFEKWIRFLKENHKSLFQKSMAGRFENDLEGAVPGSLRVLPAAATPENAPGADTQEQFKDSTRTFEIGS